MKIKKRKLSTVFAVILAVIFILQLMIFILFAHMSGIIKEMNGNAEDVLIKHAERSSYFIEMEMLKKWWIMKPVNLIQHIQQTQCQ